jgi:hypothetical protein
MKTIFKYSIKLEDEFSIMLPSKAEILSVQTQRNIPFMGKKKENFDYQERDTTTMILMRTIDSLGLFKCLMVNLSAIYLRDWIRPLSPR